MPRSSTTALPRLVLTGVLTALASVVAMVVPSSATAAPATRSPVPGIEGFSPYQGQTACDPVARPGLVTLRSLVLEAYPDTADAGMTRACSVGGASEHKEGRAWDWRVSSTNPAQVADVEDLFGWLLATDEHGNSAAMARRLGIMYVIWNGQVWKSYQAAKGWQPYAGANPHTDHVHFSLSWAGALQRTSYWTGTVSGVVASPLVTSPPAATATVGITDRRTKLDRRRAVIDGLPGPWRRH